MSPSTATAMKYKSTMGQASISNGGRQEMHKEFWWKMPNWKTEKEMGGLH